MGFFSRSSGKRHYGDQHRGSSYYKREGFLNRIFKMLGSFSSSDKRYNRHHSHDSHHNYQQDQRHHSDHKHYSEHSRHRRKYKSSWS